MKKRLVTYILVSAMAAAVFAGCNKSEGQDAAASGDAAVTEAAGAEATGVEAAVTEEIVQEAAGAEATVAAAEDSTQVEAEAASTEEAAVEEYVDDEDDEESSADDAAVKDEGALVVDPGTQYTVRFGGNIYASPSESDAIVAYAEPGWVLNIVERLDNYWYKVSFWLTGEGVEHIGYIQIQ